MALLSAEDVVVRFGGLRALSEISIDVEVGRVTGLNEDETESMAALLRVLVSDGLAVLLVEHDMSFVMGTCQFIYVLDFGRIIASGTPLEVQGDAAVQAAYLGSAAEVA